MNFCFAKASLIFQQKTGLPLHFEIGGTFGLIPYFCTLDVQQHIGDLIVFWGTSQISGGKKPSAEGKREC